MQQNLETNEEGTISEKRTDFVESSLQSAELPNRRLETENNDSDSCMDPQNIKSADISSEMISDIKRYVELPETISEIRKIHRSEFLPYLFRLRGKPYSLRDRPQLKPFFDNEYVKDTIFLAGRQVGKSLSLSRSEVLDLVSVPELQLLYVAPLQQQTQRFSKDYLYTAIASCDLATRLQSKELEGVLSDSKILMSESEQSFANGSTIKLTYAKTSPDRARGIYADKIDFDEIQDQHIDNIPVIRQSLRSSKWGVSRYTGTAKTLDNTIEHLWQQSNMCEWVMKCDHCGCWNIPNEEGNVLDMLQAEGLVCVKCGNILNVRNGEWVPNHPDRNDSFRGFHLPQIIFPEFTENPSAWNGIIADVMRYPLPMVFQEILGISYSIGSRIISESDIRKQSTLPSVDIIQKHLNRYVMTVSGVDWGGAEQSSFTVHVILGVRPDGRLDVIWARRFAGFDPDEVLTEIARAHKFYHCSVLAADYGMGFDKNIMLKNRFGLEVSQFMFCRQHNLMSYNPTLGQNRWMLDKTTALEILFLSIKYGRIYFPPFEEFELYTKDLLSPYEQISETGGITSRKFMRDPSRPDDFCMALCFGAILAMKMNSQTILDMIPHTAFGSGHAVGTPVDVPLDPDDMAAGI